LTHAEGVFLLNHHRT